MRGSETIFIVVTILAIIVATLDQINLYRRRKRNERMDKNIR